MPQSWQGDGCVDYTVPKSAEMVIQIQVNRFKSSNYTLHRTRKSRKNVQNRNLIIEHLVSIQLLSKIIFFGNSIETRKLSI